MNPSTTLSADERNAIRAAAAWYARQCSGSFGGDEQAAWQAWLEASELHRHAWQQVEDVRASLGSLPGHLAGPVLRDAHTGRRQALRTLAICAAITPLGWLGYRGALAQGVGADLRTAVGERLAHKLADGSSLILDTDSAVDVAFDPQQRLLRLHRGQILVTTAHDPQARPGQPFRPFLVQTAHGRSEALGTRFTVCIQNGHTRVAVLDERVRITLSTATERSRILDAGQQITFDDTGFSQRQPASPATGAWAGGSLVAVDMPLAELLAELSRYRHGLLRCDPAIAGLLISGAFPLDDTNRALRLLVETFPLQAVSRTRYWVEIHPA